MFTELKKTEFKKREPGKCSDSNSDSAIEMGSLIFFCVIRNEKKARQLKNVLFDGDKFKNETFMSLTQNLIVSYICGKSSSKNNECHINFGDFRMIVIDNDGSWPIVKFALNHDDYRHTTDVLIHHDTISVDLYEYYTSYDYDYTKYELSREEIIKKFFNKFDGNIQEYFDSIARLWTKKSIPDDSDDE
jgi:hypothetical protein